MALKKLIEEIEADMVHYSAKEIFFFIYDKEKIIENPSVFKNVYEEKMKDKQIHIIIHQPKICKKLQAVLTLPENVKWRKR